MWFRFLLSWFSANPDIGSARKFRNPAKRRRRARSLFLEQLDPRRVMAFDPFSEYAIGSQANLHATGDFNGDGRLDAIVSSTSGISLARGNGDGSLQTPTLIDGTWAKSVAVGDLNNDGMLDLVTEKNIFLGNGNGSFQSPIAINLPAQTPPGYSSPVAQEAGSVAVGDLNGDGKLDLVVTGRSTVNVLVGWGPYGMYYNTYSSGHVNVLLGHGDGTVTNASTAAFPQQSNDLLSLTDINHDGRLDLVMASNGNYGMAYRALGNGDGSLGALTSIATNAFSRRQLLLGDFDEDGNVDLLQENGDGYSFSLIRGRGDGSFEAPNSIPLEQNGYGKLSVVIGDINADGHLDIAYTQQRLEVTEYGIGYGYYGTYTFPTAGIMHHSVKVIMGTGTGTFSAPVTVDLGSHEGLYGEFSAPLLNDFDGDGLLDLAVADRYIGLLKVALNDGQWAPPPAISVADVTVVEGDSGQKIALVTVTLTGDHNGVTVNYMTSLNYAAPGTDYLDVSGTLTFAAGVFSQTFAVPILGDRIGEYDEDFFVLLTGATGGVLIDRQATVTILDNEPRISIDHPYGNDALTVVEGDSGTKPAVFTVTLSRAYDQEVTVRYYTLTGHTSDIISQEGTLRFAPGETSKTISVQVVGDRFYEQLEAFNVYLDSPSANASLGNSAGYCFIEDNDPAPTLSIGDVTKNEGNNGTTRFTFTVTLSAPAGNDVYVDYATANGTATAGQDYTAKSGYIYIAAGKTTATITIDVKGDRTKEANETFFINLGTSSGAVVADGQAKGTISNDDGKVTGGAVNPPRIQITDASVREGAQGTKVMYFTVTLSAPSTSVVRVNFATQDDTAKVSDNDYVAASGVLEFLPGQTSKKISIVVKGDRKRESDESFFVHLSSAVGADIATTQGWGRILNDD